MRWTSDTLPVVDAGARPPRAARVVTLLWPCWAVPCDLYERVAATRELDLFEEAVLGLSAAGLRHIGETATALGLDRELIAFVARSLTEQRLLDERHAITESGRAFLDRQLDEAVATRTSSSYCVVDAVTGKIWSRMLERFESDDGSEPHSVRVPPSSFAAGSVPEHSAAEVMLAVRRARDVAGVLAAIERATPSWNASEPCFIRTYAYRRSLDTRQEDMSGWTVDTAGCVADPFGLVLRDERLTDALRAPAEAWSERVLQRLEPVDDDSAATLAHNAYRRTAEVRLRARLPRLAHHPELLDELVTAHAMANIAEPRAACVSLATVLNDVFKVSLADRPGAAALARFPRDDDAARAHLSAALEACGFEPEAADGLLRSFRGDRAGSVRADALRVVLAAADDEDHPLRVLAARDSSGDGLSHWMLDLVPLAGGRNVAVHESGRGLGPASAASLERYMCMTDAAVEHLLEVNDGKR